MIDRYLQILAEAGIKPTIVPCYPGTKRPAVKWAQGRPETLFQDGTIVADRADTRTRVLLTGVRSTNVVVIDIDTKAEGFEHFDALERTLGPLPQTLTVRTPTGGLHMYFTHPALFRSVANVNKIMGVDIRAEGGVVVTPGSQHPTEDGLYVIEDERPISMLPARWADWLPRAKDPSEIVQAEYVTVEPSVLRDRLHGTAARRQGDGWAAWRRCAKGERMFRIEGGPGGDDLPIVHGVDEFVSKAMIWPLAHAEGWSDVDPEAFSHLVDPAFSLLRSDAGILGQVSKITQEALAGKWEAATQKSQADQAKAAAFVARMEAHVTEAKAPGVLAPILQFDRKYMVLDDRTEIPRYTGLFCAEAVPLLARTLWGDRRVTETPDKQGIRDMTPAELVSAYGKPIETLILDYTYTAPAIEDLSLVRGPERLTLPEPLADDDVGAWLDTLDPTGGILDWIAWASPERAGTTVPALTLIGGAHVGKSLLADGISRAAGLRAAEPLRRALGQFNSALAASPVLFSDEGFPRNPVNGQPQTEEFRQLITRVDHSCELKGSDKRLIVRGGVRAILAANRLDRLFSNRGSLGADDVAAIIRRLFVIDVQGDERIARAMTQARALGRTEGDPQRLLRVARHCRYLQVTRPLTSELAPRAGKVTAELRKGGDLMRAALAVLEDVIGVAGWVKLDIAHGLVWVQFDPWARAAMAQSSQSLGRAAEPYVKVPTMRYDTDPVTGQNLDQRQRWTGLDLERLRLDGVSV